MEKKGMEIKQKTTKIRDRIVLFILFLLIGSGYFSIIMDSHIDPNEHVYISAGVLSPKNILYKELSFMQMPYLPMFYSWLFSVFPTSNYLLLARVSCFIWVMLACWFAYSIGFILSKNQFIGTMVMLFFSFNAIIMIVAREISNYIQPLNLFFLSFYLLIKGFENKKYKKTILLLSGVSLALAIGFKLYNIFLVPAFLLTLFIFPRDCSNKEKIVSALLPFGSGLFLGLVPIIVLYLQDIPAFIFNNFEYHLINARWMESIGFTEGMTWLSKLNYLKKLLYMPSNLAIILSLFMVGYYVISKPRKKSLGKSPYLLFLGVALFSSTLILFQRPFWIQYFSFPIPFLVLCIASGYLVVSESRKKVVMVLLTVISLISITTGSRILFSSIGHLWDTSSWTPVKVFKTSTCLTRQIEQYNTGESEKIATLSPIYALQAGLPIYKELATGSFFYRVADMVSTVDQTRFGIIGVQGLNLFLKKNPPRAILLEKGGLYNLNPQFLHFARNNNYKEIKLKNNRLILYVSQK